MPADDREERAPWILWLGALVIVAALAFATPAPAPKVSDPFPESRGGQIAATVCSSCHLTPDPAAATRFEWAMELLPRKQEWLSLRHFDFNRHPGGERVAQAALFPRKPLLSADDWRSVCEHYLAQSPVRPAINRPRPTASTRFQATPLDYPGTADLAVVRVDPGGVFYVGNVASNALHVITPDGRIVAAPGLAGPPVDLFVNADGLFVTTIGDFAHSDLPRGELQFIGRPRPGGAARHTLLTELMRPVHTGPADLNGDGREDLLVCERGGLLGRFSLLENLGSNRFAPLPLFDRPGAVQSVVADFDGDTRPDIAVASAHARERIEIFSNTGNGFQSRTVAERGPTWNFSTLAAADLDSDGRIDLIAGNGADEDPRRVAPQNRPNHGVRAWLNRGEAGFEEVPLLALAGVRRVLVRDFDADQSPDIAVLADDLENPLVLLRNDGNAKFTAESLDAGTARWFDVDAGDVDGDGDLDLVAVAWRSSTGVPAANLGEWDKAKRSVLVLRNQLR